MHYVTEFLAQFDGAPLLQSLQCMHNFPSTPHSCRSLRLPALRQLKVINGCLECLSLPGSLTSLYLSYLPCDGVQLRTILRCCPLLHTLVLESYGPQTGDLTYPFTIVESTSVKQFAVELATTSASRRPKIARLSFPSLEYLELGEETTSDRLQQLFPPSSTMFSSLHTLHLHDYFGVHNALPFLLSLKAMRHLILADVNLKSMNWPVDAWPDLKRIEVVDSPWFCSEDGTEISKLADFTRERQKISPDFCTVVIDEEWCNQYPEFELLPLGFSEKRLLM
ncbi:hypothetical protein BD626DRAFT_571986 [Schizophyllum amplum]|uniref:F-box domain-containing protein n=1 Tax=Schizophyllum amplum TaxID=97359 RepID=A0A550C5Y1_9AGAR|nr:hypothetical protein BD626DRAFT_571986 [Auriculariopsis ampla]